MARVSRLRVSRLGLAAVLVSASCAWGQSVISAHSGMIHYVEGKVLLDGQQVDPKFGEFPEVKNDQVLETAEGRAEVLLTPGVFLRLAENTSFKMLSNKLSDTALEMQSGSAMIEVDELMKDNAITIRYKDATIALDKPGLYRVDSDTSRLRVYDGEASVTHGIKTVQVHKGKQADLNEALLTSMFDTKDTDAFYRWVSRRSEYIAAANVSSAHAAGQGGLTAGVPCTGQASTTADPNASFATTGTGSAYCNPYGDPYGYGSGYGYGSLSYYGYGYSPYGMWAWNPYYGMFTYLPGMGYGYSPFGWTIYSPMTVGGLYVPGAYGRAGAYRGVGATPLVGNRGTGPTALAGAHPATATAASAVRPSGSAVGQARAASSMGSSSVGGARGASIGGGGGGGGGGAHGGGGGGGHR